jgi:hypothetical protein
MALRTGRLVPRGEGLVVGREGRTDLFERFAELKRGLFDPLGGEASMKIWPADSRLAGT